jgi:hypothetical protein
MLIFYKVQEKRIPFFKAQVLNTWKETMALNPPGYFQDTHVSSSWAKENQRHPLYGTEEGILSLLPERRRWKTS